MTHSFEVSATCSVIPVKALIGLIWANHGTLSTRVDVAISMALPTTME